MLGAVLLDNQAMAKAMEDNKWDLLTGQLSWEPAAKGHETHKQAAMVKLTGGKPSFIGWLMPSSRACSCRTARGDMSWRRGTTRRRTATECDGGEERWRRPCCWRCT